MRKDGLKMKRKSLIFLSLIVALITVLLMQTAAFASNEATISVADVSAENGELVNVDVTISNNPGIVGLRVFVEYDTSKLQLQSVTDGNVFAAGLSTFNDDLSVSKYTMLWIDGTSSTNYSNDGVLATLTFKVLDATAEKSIPVEITYDENSTFNSNLDNVTFSTKNGSVKIEEKTYKVIWNVDGVISEQKVVPGSSILKPANPVKKGYKFMGWTPAIPETMPAYDLTFIAVFEKIYNCPNCGEEILGEDAINEHIASEIKNSAKVSIKNNPNNKTINFGETLRLTAETSNLPAGAKIYWYVNGNKVGEGETFDVTLSKGSVEVTVKLVDANGNVLKNVNGEEISDSETVSVNSSFWQKIVSFFKNLFGIDRTVVQAIFRNVL